ncbi:MAG TPA: PPOX class F420-dependent oxidoreductase [Nitrososphaeraceae archaeon]|nr:PPOX class F420-dependent oxidoreductase [Nitrososphaeraceae archaeon]
MEVDPLNKDNNPTLFSENETKYLFDNRLGRLATVSSDNQPHVVPVSYNFDGTDLFFGDWDLKHSLKFRHILKNNKVAMVVDDLLSVNPWVPRGIEIRGITVRIRGD